MTEQTQQLQTQLWNIANTLRGKMDADDFRDYILDYFLLPSEMTYLSVWTTDQAS